jgi:hypothetical protein
MIKRRSTEQVSAKADNFRNILGSGSTAMIAEGLPPDPSSPDGVPVYASHVEIDILAQLEDEGICLCFDGSPSRYKKFFAQYIIQKAA